MNIFQILGNFANYIGWGVLVIAAFLFVAWMYERIFPWW